MAESILPIANWGAGTAIIIVFAVVCIVLTALVINFVMKGKKKNKED
ncbi:hypothetical protein [Aequorivita sp. Q41]